MSLIIEEHSEESEWITTRVNKMWKNFDGDFIKHSIEPIVFFYAISKILLDMITPNAIELQYCYSTLNVSKEDCFNQSNDYFGQTQKVVAELNIIRACFESFMPIIVLILVGPSIEIYGHRLLMLISTFGWSIAAFCWALGSYFPYFSPYYTILFGIPMMIGGEPLAEFICDCYTCHITSTQNRSFRFGMVSASFFTGYLVGSWLCSITENFSYSLGFLLMTISICCAFLYTYFVLEEPHTFTKIVAISRRESFNLRPYNFREIFPSCFTKLTNRMRIVIVTLCIVHILCISFIVGTRSIEYMYLQKTQNWTLSMYSNLMGFSILAHCAVAFIGNWWLNVKLKLSDLHILIIISISQFFSMLVFANSTETWQIYCCNILKSSYGLFVPTVKSFLSKAVFKEDIGKIITTIIILGQLSTFIGQIIFNTLYREALSTSPSMPFNIAAIMAYAMCCIILLANELNKKEIVKDYDIIM
ncbi:uncharacterized protein LOC135849736 [Planococcus citri]|uniref:uncharacterized protein LOC135849736 n=1 Tax=Planococcus citri TaxID=170843 RepID=UPI0031F80358